MPDGPGCTVGPTGRCLTKAERQANQRRRVTQIQKLKARTKVLRDQRDRARGVAPRPAPGRMAQPAPDRIGLEVGAPMVERELPGAVVAAPGPSAGLATLGEVSRPSQIPPPQEAVTGTINKIEQLGNTTSPSSLVRAALKALTPTPVNVPGSQMVPVAWTGRRRRRFGGFAR